MTDLTSVTSSAAAFVSQQTTALTKAASSATTSFAATLSKVQTAIVGGPRPASPPARPMRPAP